MKVLVLGATGSAGRSTLPLLLAAGHDVHAHARSDTGHRWIATLGATPVRGDSSDPARLRTWLRGCDAVIDLRVRVPEPAHAPLPWAWRDYARLRGRECGVLVDAALDAEVSRVVRDTVTMTYDEGDDAWLDESFPTRASGALAANLVAEHHLARFTAFGGSGVVIRCGGFYGPHDEFSKEVMAAARKGRSLILGPAAGWTSAIHTADVGRALAAALTAPAGIYNAVDDEPLTRRELHDLLADAAGRTVRPYPAWTVRLTSGPVRSLARSHRVTNAKLRDLGWRPSIPSRRQGWPDVFARQPEGPEAPKRDTP